MDTTQIAQELEDLEARMERLRALYEQYFLGLEKLEPTVLRKDVDRKLWVLRREKIRNTGMRFKFQGLVQRYNTYQQYWTRVVREIEAGTYRRDILKVAQRFGEKDAITLLGKKRAEQYRRLAQNQIDRRNKRKAATDEAAQPASPAELDDTPIALGADDIELVDDDADTPTPPRLIPPVRAVPPARPAGPTARDAEPEPDMEALLLAATVGVTAWTQRPKTAPPPPPKPPSTTAPRRPSAAPPPPPKPASAAPPAPPRRPSAAPPKRASAAPPAPPRRPSAAPPKRASTVPPKPSPQESAAPTAAKQAPPATSAKSRVAELAAQMRAKKEATKPVTADLDLDNLFNAKPAAAPPPSPQPAPPKPATAPSATASPLPKPAPTFAPSAPQPGPAAPSPATTFTPSAPQPRPAAATPPPAPKPAAATPPAPKPAAAAPPPPAARPAPAPSATASPLPKPAASPPSREALDDQRVREIYARYVGAKRAANESTAGVTFDKLAQSLRAQADKLKSTHPTKSVDFEVVVKDGKTALRPILK